MASHLFGKLQLQPSGYRAFVPEPFPPRDLPPLNEATLALHEGATVQLGRLDGITELLPDVDFFIFMYVRKEAVLSSQLEGTLATMVDAIKAEGAMRTGLPSDVDDIIHYIEAMNFGLRRLEDLPLSMRLICEVHRELMEGGRTIGHATPGEIRTTQNWIGGTSPAGARFVPPPPHLVRQALSDLERYLHHDDSAILVKAGLAHAQFETIHPFPDGNGRTGRLLITFYLCQQGLLHRPVLYLSEFFKRHRDLYFDRLDGYHNRGEVLPWLSFFFEGVATVATEAIAVCRGVTALRDRDMARVSTMGKAAPNAITALRWLFRNPVVAVKNLQDATGLSRQNANGLVKRLVDAQILVPSDPSVEYGRTFAYADYLDIFNSQ